MLRKGGGQRESCSREVAGPTRIQREMRGGRVAGKMATGCQGSDVLGIRSAAALCDYRMSTHMTCSGISKLSCGSMKVANAAPHIKFLGTAA